MARPRKFDEAQVLEAVRDEFWAKGYTATSLDDLMKATGLGKGSLYGAFGDKHQLFLKVLGIYAGERVVGVHEALSGEGSAIERLRAVFDVPESPDGDGDDGDEAARGCLLANSSTELAALDDDVTACARKTYQAVEDLLVDTVALAVTEGDLPADTVPRDLGRLLFAVQQGVEFLGKTGMSPAALRQIGRSAAAALLR
jgi:AcrR family transcriptional regulator